MTKAKQWRPYSSEEAMDFGDRFCSRCSRDAAFRAGTGDSCSIAADGFGVALGLDPPVEWVTGPTGPRCTAWIEDQGVAHLMAKAAAYEALPRDPVTGRPTI